jgi:hypothetical protein
MTVKEIQGIAKEMGLKAGKIKKASIKGSLSRE